MSATEQEVAHIVILCPLLDSSAFVGVRVGHWLRSACWEVM